MTGQRHRSDIDGLRCVAVLAVVANHFSHSLLPSGHLGVDVFFVISGYVVTLSLMGRGKAPLSEFLLGFYGRRVKRLGPALIACVAISSVLLCFFSMDPGASLKTGLSALVGLANIIMDRARLADESLGLPRTSGAIATPPANTDPLADRKFAQDVRDHV